MCRFTRLIYVHVANGGMNGWIDRCMDEFIHVANGRMDGLMDRLLDKFIEGRKVINVVNL